MSACSRLVPLSASRRKERGDRETVEGNGEEARGEGAGAAARGEEHARGRRPEGRR